MIRRRTFLMYMSLFVFFCFSISQLNAQSIQGTWKVKKVKCINEEAGIIVNQKEYNIEDPLLPLKPYLQELTFVSDSLLTIMFKGYDFRDTAPYTISRDTLIWTSPAAILKYQLKQNKNGSLILTSEEKYDDIKNTYIYSVYRK